MIALTKTIPDMIFQQNPKAFIVVVGPREVTCPIQQIVYENRSIHCTVSNWHNQSRSSHNEFKAAHCNPASLETYESLIDSIENAINSYRQQGRSIFYQDKTRHSINQCIFRSNADSNCSIGTIQNVATVCPQGVPASYSLVIPEHSTQAQTNSTYSSLGAHLFEKIVEFGVLNLK